MHAIRLRRLHASNAQDLQEFQAVFCLAPSFTFLTKGQAPTGADAERLMKLVPPNLTEDDKQIMAVYCSEELVGCAVLVFSYPNEKVAFIALLLIIESLQSNSLGAEVLRNIEAIATSAGYDRLELVVDSANERAHAFWAREGFTEKYRKPSSEFIGEVILMERTLNPQPSQVTCATSVHQPDHSMK